jgi:hypothetical protein
MDHLYPLLKNVPLIREGDWKLLLRTLKKASLTSGEGDHSRG